MITWCRQVNAVKCKPGLYLSRQGLVFGSPSSAPSTSMATWGGSGGSGGSGACRPTVPPNTLAAPAKDGSRKISPPVQTRGVCKAAAYEGHTANFRVWAYCDYLLCRCSRVFAPPTHTTDWCGGTVLVAHNSNGFMAHTKEQPEPAKPRVRQYVAQNCGGR